MAPAGTPHCKCNLKSKLQCLGHWFLPLVSSTTITEFGKLLKNISSHGEYFIILTHHNPTRMHWQTICRSWIQSIFVEVCRSYCPGLSVFSSTNFPQSLRDLDFYENIFSLCDYVSITVVGILPSRETMVLKLHPGQPVVVWSVAEPSMAVESDEESTTLLALAAGVAGVGGSPSFPRPAGHQLGRCCVFVAVSRVPVQTHRKERPLECDRRPSCAHGEASAVEDGEHAWHTCLGQDARSCQVMLRSRLRQRI